MINIIMNKKIIFLSLILSILFTSQNVSAATIDNSNVGFVPSNIWYSNDPDTEGEKVRIYTVVFNPYQKEFSGEVSFYDGEILLGKKTFTISSIGTKDVYIDWTVSLGTHKIFAKITNAKYLISKGVYEQVNAEESTSDTSSYTVYKKILPNISDVKDNVTKTVNDIKNPVNNLEQKILESTPDYVSKPIINSSNFLENWRGSQIEIIDTKKDAVKSEIDILQQENSKVEVLKEESDTNTDNNTDNKNTTKSIGEEFKSSTTTPFKYVELFFLTILSFIIGNKIIFYATLVLIFALFIKILWRKIFK